MGSQGASDQEITVLIAEDVNMVRGALVALLSLEPDITVVADVADGSAVLDAVRAHQPTVALLDVDLPGVDGITLAGQLDESTRVLLVTSLSNPATLQRSLSAAIDGFLLKDAPPQRLAEAVRIVAGGGRVIDPELAMVALQHGPCPLTVRELDVLRLIAGGLQPPEVAQTLFLSAGTVRNYLGSAVTKLNARNRVDAIRIAAESGWI